MLSARKGGDCVKLWYLDTSAAMKLIAQEKESDALDEAIVTESPALFSSTLLETELRRARRFLPEIGANDIEDLIDAISIFEFDRSIFRVAGMLPGKHLRSLDAIHIAAALLGGCTAMVTYDHRMAEAAEEAGLTVVSPGSAWNP